MSPNGSTVDLIANKSIRSGKIAAYLDMRDNVLVQAQNQLDSLAATMAQALSDDTVNGTTVSSGAQTGLAVDTAGWLDGNRVNLTYTDRQTSIQHRVSIIRVDDPAALPLDDGATADPNDEVIGVDFSGGLASVVSQLNARFGGRLQFANPSGTTLQVLDDGAPNLVDVNALSLTRTATAVANGRTAVALFTDGTDPFTGAITSVGAQSVGFAGRIAVNPALLGDPSKLTIYDANTASGDPARPNLIYDRLTNAAFAFAPQTGLGNAASPFAGNLPTYLQQMLSLQGEAAANASSLSQGQDVVVNALKQRVNDASGRQYRSGDGQSDFAADRLWRQRARHGGGSGHARHADEDVRLVWRYRELAGIIRRRCSRSPTCAISSTTFSASLAPARSPIPMPVSGSTAD